MPASKAEPSLGALGVALGSIAAVVSAPACPDLMLVAAAQANSRRNSISAVQSAPTTAAP